MAIIINEQTRVVIQGMTGREGSRAAKEMIDYGTSVSCGVTPGKGGKEVECKPIFNTIAEALAHDSTINISVLYVPPLRLYGAAMEAMENGIKTIVIITENVPIKDTAKLVEYSKEHNCRIVGPSSVGVLVPGVAKLGSIAGAQEKNMFMKGNVGVISKSGGMCAETSLALTLAGIGQSTIIGIGGDVILGSTFTEIMDLFQDDPDTDAVVMFGEIGGTYEDQVAEYLKAKKFTKPVIAFISGRFAESIGKNLALGHAGAIVEHGMGKAVDKKQLLREAGALVANFHHEIPDLVKQALKK